MANRRRDDGVVESREKLGLALRNLRQRLDLSLESLGDVLETNAGSLSRSERGESMPADRLKDWIDTIATRAAGAEMTEAVFDYKDDRIAISLRRLYELAGLDAPEAIKQRRPHGLTASWDENISAGNADHASGRHTAAITWYDTAKSLATTNGQRALAEASIGLVHRDLNDLKEAESRSSQALTLLGLADLNPTQEEISPTVLNKRLHDDASYEAFAVTAKTLGQIFSSREKFVPAGKAYQSLVNVSRFVKNGQMRQAEALHHLGTSLIEAGTGVGEAPEWRTSERPKLIEEGLKKIREARNLRLSHDPVGTGHDWHQEFKAHLLFERYDDAENAMQEADEYYGDSPARINRAVDRARLAMSKGEMKVAREQHELTVEIAKEINSNHQLSRAYTGLAMVFFLQDEVTQAKRYCIEAIWTWPFDFDARDFELPVQIFSELNGQPGDFGSIIPPVAYSRARLVMEEMDRRFLPATK